MIVHMPGAGAGSAGPGAGTGSGTGAGGSGLGAGGGVGEGPEGSGSGAVDSMKDAVTAVSAVRTNEQGLCVPLQAPVQPTNVDPASGTGLRATLVPSPIMRLQDCELEAQEKPGTPTSTMPAPSPANETDRVRLTTNSAVTVRELFIVTLQWLPATMSHPLQPFGNAMPFTA